MKGEIGSPGTYEFSDPDGVLGVKWIGQDDAADGRARQYARELEQEAGGEYLVTGIRRRTDDGWERIRPSGD
jgi:hypothetical protein